MTAFELAMTVTRTSTPKVSFSEIYIFENNGKTNFFNFVK